jgi:hypothetical protein
VGNFPSQFLHAGIILSHSLSRPAASLLSPVIVDPENVYIHVLVLPFIAFGTQIIRQQVINNNIIAS